MTLDEETLREATTLRDRLLELQHETERTRVDYHHVIRRLQAGGGSLREIADALGLSHQRVHQIVEESAGLPQQMPVPPPVFGPPGWRRGGRRAFERFTRAARAAVALAQEEAEEHFGHNYIGTEHLLLGLLRAEGGGAAQALGALGVTLDRARQELARVIGEGRGAECRRGQRGRQIPFTPRAKRALEQALREARSRRHGRIGTEHVLLALVHDEEGVAARILAELGFTRDAVSEQVERIFAS